jgi:hypothetical protein
MWDLQTIIDNNTSPELEKRKKYALNMNKGVMTYIDKDIALVSPHQSDKEYVGRRIAGFAKNKKPVHGGYPGG